MAAPVRWSKLTRTFVFYFSRNFSNNVNENVRVRFAPSPTGQLHLGGLRTALLNYLFAKSNDGKFVLRIEDTDRTRIVPGALEKLEEMLNWAGLSPDESPSVGGSYGPYIQSERMHLYQEHVETLIKSGHAYKCFCTAKRLALLRKEALRQFEVPRYDNKCRHLTDSEVEENLAQDKPYVIRFKYEPLEKPWIDLVYGNMHSSAVGETLEGDFIIMKTDGYPTYHFANVVDDHLMNISHVLRGEEWSISTPKHIQMYEAFGWDQPRYAHLPLLLNSDGTKLSKRQGDINVESYKDKNQDPNALLNYLTTVNGGFLEPTDGMNLEEMASVFSLERLNTHSSRLQPEKLSQLNKKHLHRRFYGDRREDVIEEMQKLIEKEYSERFLSNPSQRYILDRNYIEDILDWSLQSQRICQLDDLLDRKHIFLWTPNTEDNIREIISENSDYKDIIGGTISALKADDEFSEATIASVLQTCNSNWKMGRSSFMNMLRKSLSSSKAGPPVSEMMAILGKQETIIRLNMCLDCCNSEKTGTSINNA